MKKNARLGILGEVDSRCHRSRCQLNKIAQKWHGRVRRMREKRIKEILVLVIGQSDTRDSSMQQKCDTDLPIVVILIVALELLI
jgi:hypothetical protein